jgi:hypothetical protein
MKVLTNNQLNKILLVKSGENLLDVQNAVLRQLGSDVDVVIPITVDSEDCFTAELHLTLSDNQLANASYTLKVIDSLSSVISSFTLQVDWNNDETRAYIIIDE